MWDTVLVWTLCTEDFHCYNSIRTLNRTLYLTTKAWNFSHKHRKILSLIKQNWHHNRPYRYGIENATRDHIHSLCDHWHTFTEKCA